MLKNTPQTYGSVSKTLHWLMALGFIGMIILGFMMTDMATPEKYAFYKIHKALGFSLLSLAVFRLIWRFMNITPSLPISMSTASKLSAHLGHISLYLLMIGVPLSGLLMSSAAGSPVSFFGFFTIPSLMPENRDILPLFKDAHEYLNFTLIAMISLHFFAGLYHYFIRKDTVMQRMIPFKK